MKTCLLINSTRNVDHIGCKLTVSGLSSILLNCNLKIEYEISIREPSLESLIKSFGDKVDYLIVNGEGTFHDDQAEALRIVKALNGYEYKTYLMNTQFHNMSHEICASISKFGAVVCRTTADRNEAEALLSCLVLYHSDGLFFSSANFYHENLPTKERRAFLGYSDGHEYYPTKLELLNIFLSRDKKWISINVMSDDSPRNFVHRVKRIYAALRLNSNQFNKSYARTLSDYFYVFSNLRQIVTGRYHLACLAILFNVSLCFKTSNTPKLERLLEDFCSSAGGTYRMSERKYSSRVCESLETQKTLSCLWNNNEV